MIDELFKIFDIRNKKNYLQDFSDRVNSGVTVIMMLILSTLMCYKTYIVSPMQCYSANSPSGNNFENYLTSYCWVEGTIPLGHNVETPTEWNNKEKVIIYYPWIPIILVMQCLLFYFPKLIWCEYCSNTAGTDLQNIVSSSISASQASIANRIEPIKDIASIIEALFHMHRDNRHGVLTDVKRRISQKLPILIWGKRSGNSILGVYLGVKFLYILIAVAQCFLMSRTLQLDSSFFSVFFNVINFVFHGYNWNATIYFPRVTYCNVQGIRALGSINNKYIAQCVLPINVLNEKIYIFLFLWMVLLITLSILYSLKWFYVMGFRSPKRQFVKVYLKGKNIFKKMEEPLIDKFIGEFLRLDGIFLMRMIRINAGDLVAASVMEQLWIIYKSKYRHLDLSNTESAVHLENLTLKLEPGEQKATMKTKNKLPTAPKEIYF